MSRSRRAPSSPVQLFPFLAVLVSTIGALVLLLLAINRQATMQAIARAVGLLAQQTNSEEEVLALRGNELESEVVALREQLLRLGVEQQDLDETLFAADHRAHGDAARTDAIRRDLAAIRARRVEVERDLAAVKQQIAAGNAAKARLAVERTNAHQTFVPIVHPGANGTDRQPIYIECTGESVTIWPENISVPTAALSSNVYAQAALARTVRELGQYYLDRDRHTEPGVRKRLEPYPLLLVRPDGVEAYRAVCDALVRERGLSFGYELIEADWSLRFPDADPRARDVAIAAIKKTSLGVRLTAGDSHRPPFGNISTQASGSQVAGDQPSEKFRSGNDALSKSSFPRGGSGELPLPRSPMADGSRLYSDESVFSQLADGASEPTPVGPATPQRPAGSRQVAEQPREKSQDTERSLPADPRVTHDMTEDQATTSEYEPTRHASRRKPSPRRHAGADEPSDGSSSIGPLAGNPHGAGKITVPRRIDTVCTAGRLIVGQRQAAFTLPSTGSFHEVIDELRDEIDREVAAWGPPGEFFQWEPQLFCRVRADALEAYYQLRFEMAGSSIAFDHEMLIGSETQPLFGGSAAFAE